jgi:hypothetical protein
MNQKPVRNFLIEASVDGYVRTFRLGPRSKGGGFKVTIRQRHQGQYTVAYRITGFAQDGRLICSIGQDGTVIHQRETVR